MLMIGHRIYSRGRILLRADRRFVTLCGLGTLVLDPLRTPKIFRRLDGLCAAEFHLRRFLAFHAGVQNANSHLRLSIARTIKPPMAIAASSLRRHPSSRRVNVICWKYCHVYYSRSVDEQCDDDDGRQRRLAMAGFTLARVLM